MAVLRSFRAVILCGAVTYGCVAPSVLPYHRLGCCMPSAFSQVLAGWF